MGNSLRPCNNQETCGTMEVQLKLQEDFQTVLLRAVGDRDIGHVQNILETPIAIHHLPQLSSAILDRAIMQLLSQTSDIDLAILELLLNYGAQDVSKDILYSVISLLCLANLELAAKVTSVVARCTQSRIITGTLLKSLVHCKQVKLLEIIITCVDLDSYWDDPFYMKDHRMCGTSLDAFTENRLLSPPIAQLFIIYSQNESTLRKTFKTILQYRTCHCEVDDRTVHKLVKSLHKTGMKFTTDDITQVNEQYPRSGDWLKRHPHQVIPSKTNVKKYVSQVMKTNLLTSVARIQQLPVCLKEFLFFNETQLVSNI